MIMTHNEIKSNYQRIFDSVNNYCVSVNRNPESLKIIVVTKSQSVAKVESVIQAGAKYLGENYPEETVKKIEELSDISKNIEWHMIGHLQSRKSQLVIDNFHTLHSLDSIKLAERLDRQLNQINSKMDVLLQFNVGGEASKYGWDASDRNNWNNLIEIVENIVSNKSLRVVGLMTMPPYSENEALSRKNFHALVSLGQFLSEQIPNLNIQEYSMGTSHDYKMAIAEGSTMVRIGTAIMGMRTDN